MSESSKNFQLRKPNGYIKDRCEAANEQSRVYLDSRDTRSQGKRGIDGRIHGTSIGVLSEGRTRCHNN